MLKVFSEGNNIPSSNRVIPFSSSSLGFLLLLDSGHPRGKTPRCVFEGRLQYTGTGFKKCTATNHTTAHSLPGRHTFLTLLTCLLPSSYLPFLPLTFLLYFLFSLVSYHDSHHHHHHHLSLSLSLSLYLSLTHNPK